MTPDLVVLSPEKTLLTWRLAGVGQRFFAQLIDAILVIAVLIGAAVVGAALGTAVGMDVIFQAFYPVFAVAFPFLYFILLEGFWNGQTPGKKVMKIRVRMVDGTAITFFAALTRNLLRVADFIPATYLVGAIAMFLNPKSQRLGDLAAGTLVVSESDGQPYFQPSPYVLGVHRFEGAVGDLRGMTQEEYVALRRLCDRYPEFPATVQERMIRDIWQPIATKLGIESRPDVHPIYLAEAVVMKYGREKGLL